MLALIPMFDGNLDSIPTGLTGSHNPGDNVMYIGAKRDGVNPAGIVIDELLIFTELLVQTDLQKLVSRPVI